MWVKLRVCTFSRHPYVYVCVYESVSYYSLTTDLCIVLPHYYVYGGTAGLPLVHRPSAMTYFPSLFLFHTYPHPFLSLRHGWSIWVCRMFLCTFLCRMVVWLKALSCYACYTFVLHEISVHQWQKHCCNVRWCERRSIFCDSHSFSLWSRVCPTQWNRRGQPFNCSVSV